jgi:hypothetical protein
MSDTLNLVYDSIDKANADKPASTRRQFVTGAAATLGSLGFLSLADDATAQEGDSVKHILDVAATAEVLATIVNTCAWPWAGPGHPAQHQVRCP